MTMARKMRARCASIEPEDAPARRRSPRRHGRCRRRRRHVAVIQPPFEPPLPDMPHTNSRTAWTTDIAERMRWQFPLKLVGTSVVIGLFFVAYLRLLHHPG